MDNQTNESAGRTTTSFLSRLRTIFSRDELADVVLGCSRKRGSGSRKHGTEFYHYPYFSPSQKKNARAANLKSQRCLSNHHETPEDGYLASICTAHGRNAQVVYCISSWSKAQQAHSSQPLFSSHAMRIGSFLTSIPTRSITECWFVEVTIAANRRSSKMDLSPLYYGGLRGGLTTIHQVWKTVISENILFFLILGFCNLISFEIIASRCAICEIRRSFFFRKQTVAPLKKVAS